jgi:hypothetical protein
LWWADFYKERPTTIQKLEAHQFREQQQIKREIVVTVNWELNWLRGPCLPCPTGSSSAFFLLCLVCVFLKRNSTVFRLLRGATTNRSGPDLELHADSWENPKQWAASGRQQLERESRVVLKTLGECVLIYASYGDEQKQPVAETGGYVRCLP